MEPKRFKSTTGEEVRIAQTSGHVTTIGVDWTDVHPRFHSDAYASACISEDMVKSSAIKDMDPKVVNTLNNVALQKNEVTDAIKKLVRDNDLDSFDAKGKPKSTVISTMVGFRVTNATRDEVWYKVQQEMDNDAS